MDRYQTVEDMLVYSERFHTEMTDYYRHRAQASHSPRLEMMMSYLADREQNLALGLQRYHKTADHTLLKSWLDHVPELESLPILEEVTHQCDQVKDEKDAVDLALAIDHQLVDVYLALTERAGIERVAELFQNLAEQQRSEQRQLQMARLRFDDL